MLIKRFYHEGLAQASYLVGSTASGEAVVIDANRDIEQYITAAAENRLRITHVTETHIHADFLSGSRELAARTGARLLLSGEGGVEWQYAFATPANATILRDGDQFDVGEVRIEALHTPGHTPEHLTFVVTDTTASDRPLGAFTGDFIFVGDVGRPDLLERAAGMEGTMRAGAKLLFESLRRFTEHFPDYMQLWPGHGAGSACGKSLGAVPQTTLGYEKLVNWAFQIDDETKFVDAVLQGQPDPPVYFATMKRLNRDGPASRPELPLPRRNGMDLLRVIFDGHQVVDVRPAATFTKGFIRGTLNIPLTRSFVGYAGWLVPYDRDIYVLTDGDDDAVVRRAADELAMIGLDRVAGWFGLDAFAAWNAAGRSLETITNLTPDDLVAGRSSEDLMVIDVRSDSEFEGGRVPGSRPAPLGRLVEQVQDVARDTPIVLVCQSGNRSVIAASVLAAQGFHDVSHLAGGVTAWRRAGLPIERESSALTPT